MCARPKLDGIQSILPTFTDLSVKLQNSSYLLSFGSFSSHLAPTATLVTTAGTACPFPPSPSHSDHFQATWHCTATLVTTAHCVSFPSDGWMTG